MNNVAKLIKASLQLQNNNKDRKNKELFNDFC